jgi:hypothetical protein
VISSVSPCGVGGVVYTGFEAIGTPPDGPGAGVDNAPIGRFAGLPPPHPAMASNPHPARMSRPITARPHRALKFTVLVSHAKKAVASLTFITIQPAGAFSR